MVYLGAATCLDKIRKDRKPADLPVEQPIKFEFIVNLKAAMQIGLTIPSRLLMRRWKMEDRKQRTESERKESNHD
ncbi:MAG: hypothetical protein HYY82_17425 [Deltaproteobacteria bacterium]|nr:hypothetical protein [Deltaproteobacteria bacterium]